MARGKREQEMTYQVIDLEYNELSGTAKTLYEAIWLVEYATSYEVNKEGSNWTVKHYEDDEPTYFKTRKEAVQWLEMLTSYGIRKV